MKFQELAGRLVGELLNPLVAPKRIVQFNLEASSRIASMRCQNQLADASAAFEILHLLHHLDGGAFTCFSDLDDPIYNLNPAIIRTLTQHHQQTLGRPYQLHAGKLRVHRAENTNNALNFLLPTTSNRRRDAKNVVGEAGFIRTSIVSERVSSGERMAQLMELATKLGSRCQKLRVGGISMLQIS